MVKHDDDPDFIPASIPVDEAYGPDEPGLLFRDDVRENWHVWLIRFERFMYPVFAQHGYSRDAALVAFFLNLTHNALGEIRETTRAAAAALAEDPEDDWGPGAHPAA